MAEIKLNIQQGLESGIAKALRDTSDLVPVLWENKKEVTWFLIS